MARVWGGDLADASLVEQARRGDGAAFETLIRRHFRAAYSVALAQLGNAMDAEDVCQDAFLRALEKLEQCHDPERFAGWLLQIVRNQARNFRNYRQVRSAEPLETAPAESPASAAREVELEELRGRLEAALAELSDTQREVVLLHDLEGWKHREIAVNLEISEVMSRQHLFMARRALRERLGTQVLREYSHE